MESSIADLPPADKAEAANRSGKQRSRTTTDSIAEALELPESNGETLVLPDTLAELGRALDEALNSDGDVTQAYSDFADKAFCDPENASLASRYTMNLFTGQQGVLVNLVRTKDLLATLEVGSNELCRLIALRWQAEAMTQRISRFGESLIINKDRFNTPAAAEVLAAFAGLLALNKPERAATLYGLAVKIVEVPGGEDFANEVMACLSAGKVIEDLLPEDRSFWQGHLRNSGKATDWSDPAARRALQSLAGRLRPEMPCANVFKAVVPAEWWQQHVEAPTEPTSEGSVKAEPEPEPKAETSEPQPTPAPTSPPLPEVEPVSTSPAAIEQSKPKPEPEPVVAQPEPVVAVRPPAQVPAPAQIIVRRSSGAWIFLAGQLFGMMILAGLWYVEPDLLPRLVEGPAHSVPSPHASAPSVPSSALPASVAPQQAPNAIVAKAAPASANEKWCAQEAANLVVAHPSLKPWISKALDGDWNECRPLVTGQLTSAYPSPADFATFLKALMLTPPKDAEIRRAVPRLYARVAPLTDFIDVCGHLDFPGSSYAQDVPMMAQIAQEIHNSLISAAERASLKKLAGPTTP